MTVSSTNITAAAVLAQFLILLVMVIASQIMGRLYELWVPFFRRPKQSTSYSFLLLVLTLITLGLFFFSDVFVDLWRPLLGNYEIPFISWSTAITWFFLLDIACITVLVLTSGGARQSPFTPLYGLMPVISILLQEPVVWILVYALLAIGGITVGLLFKASHGEPTVATRRDPVAFWFVMVASILLATAIGIVTMPSP